MTDLKTADAQNQDLRARGTGTTEFHNGHPRVKVSLPDKTRPRYRLCLDRERVNGKCPCEGMSDAMAAMREGRGDGCTSTRRAAKGAQRRRRPRG